MHDMIPLACPMLFHLKLMWNDEGARVGIGGAEVGQNTTVGVLVCVHTNVPCRK